MKRIFITLSILTTTLAMVSCDLLGGPKGQKQVEEAPQPTPVVGEFTQAPVVEEFTPAPPQNPNEIRVYSNAFDGFVNIRQAPTTKSKIIGRLNNGNDYLVQLGVQGKWTQVQLQGQVGYVNSAVVGYTPWKPVTLGVDADWIEGAYECCVCVGECGYDLLVFNNGKFALSEGAGYIVAYGTWKFEGKDIVLLVKKIVECCGFEVGEEYRATVDVINSSIDGCRKNSYYSGFSTVKKSANQAVRLK